MDENKPVNNVEQETSEVIPNYLSSEVPNPKPVNNVEQENEVNPNYLSSEVPNQNKKKSGLPSTYSKTLIVDIPDNGNYNFSFRKLWAFSGPGFLMSIAFLDPGNIEADLQTGAVAKYKLLWVTFWATVLGLLLQRLSARIGIVTGLHLAQLCHRHYKIFPRILLWLMIEIAVIGCDMQEVIGTSLAIYILSNRVIPIYGGVIITMVDSFIFLLLDKYGLRKLELFFVLLIATMVFTFGYEYVVAAPNQGEVIKGIVLPWCSDCSSDALMQAVGMVGAVIMPHNLYLYSALVKSRSINRGSYEAVKDANRYNFIESAISLSISFLINLFVICVFGNAFSQKTNAQMLETCTAVNNPQRDIFPNNTDVISADLYTGGVALGCEFGIACMYIWGVGILAAGESSTMAGTYAGQFVMEGFLNIRWARWQRVLFTRTIAIFPTIFVAIYSGLNDMTKMNDILNTIMSIQIPFALIPTLTFSCWPVVMGKFASGRFTKILLLLIGVFILAINFYFVFSSIPTFDVWYIYLGVAIAITLYTLFVAYLFLVLIGVFWVPSLLKFLKFYVPEEDEQTNLVYSSSSSTISSESK